MTVVAQSTSTVGTLVWFDPFNICGEYSHPVLSHYFFLGRILSIYEGVKFPCNICDYKATHKERVLTRVVTTKKLQPKFSFVSIFNPSINKNLWANKNFPNTHKDSFLQHINSTQECVKFPCDQCDYRATTNANLL